MEVPRSVIDGYDETVRAAVSAIQGELRASLSLIDYAAPVGQIRAEVVALMDAYCGAASGVGARMSSEFYNGLRRMVAGRDAALSLQTGRSPQATERAVRAFVQELVDGDGDEAIEAFEGLLLERVDYEAKRAIAYNTIHNGSLDPDRPRFARVPRGERTCDFCLMLASRGPVYLTAESAGAFTKFHAHCDCKVVPFWDTVEDGASRRRSLTMSVEGYDPDALYGQYRELMRDRGAATRMPFEERMAKAAETAKARKKRRTIEREDYREPVRLVRTGRAVGAKAHNDYIINVPGVGESRFFPESDIEVKAVFAGAGSNPPKELRVRNRLAEMYGDNPENWSHVAGHGWMFDPADGRIRRAEVHWMESPEAGIQEVYWKRWVDPE